MAKLLINVSDLSLLVKSSASVKAIARAPESIDGFLLYIESGGEEKLLSTYLSDKPRLFKRSDALLKEAAKIGLSSVCFELE